MNFLYKRVLSIAPCALLLLPTNVVTMNSTRIASGGTALTLLGVGAGALFTSWYKDDQFEKEKQCEKAAAWHRLEVIKSDLDTLNKTTDLVTYARGTFGLQGLAGLQRHLDATNKKLDALPRQKEYAQMHQDVYNLLQQVRTRIGNLDPQIFAAEEAQKLHEARQKMLGEIDVERQRMLNAVAVERQQLAHASIQANIEVNKQAAHALQSQKKHFETQTQLMESQVVVNAKQAALDDKMVVVCNELPATMSQNISQAVAPLLNGQKKLATAQCEDRDRLCALVETVKQSVTSGNNKLHEKIHKSNKKQKEVNDTIMQELKNSIEKQNRHNQNQDKHNQARDQEIAALREGMQEIQDTLKKFVEQKQRAAEAAAATHIH